MTFSFFPQVGYFFVDNFAAGFRGGIGTSIYTYNQDIETSNSLFNYELGPYIRFYYELSTSAVFAELNYLYEKTIQTNEMQNYNTPEANDLIDIESTGTAWLFAPTIGFIHFFNESIGMEYSIRYETGSRETIVEDPFNLESQEDKIEEEFNGFAFIVGLQIHLNFSETN